MIIGIGNDMESISRIESVLNRRPNFLSTILTPAEQEAAKKRTGKHYLEFVAGRFSAKEAYSKALGTGIGKKASWQDITILNAPSGRPIISVRGQNNALSVAITHSGDYVATVVTIESLSFLEKIKKKHWEKTR
ncbi:holo-ACP synthase [Fructobacillus sp. M1-13]|uniref:Holo-[acyl-carrier-protein] synthase n=1 Tax=Fructobacillus papyriferae TaxID=2713171 RepID=A0ABS5QQ35_9LACO|nr:holo-ACP synthase [Fructobacillus papyriferae]MBS9335299.1 holo-ACP synthase [Fructobacillus papyriferae]MCD2159032.1 holo-ACP synthase [Fructobacillus papyriferae]